MPTALVLLAEGAEEMEAVITIDVLRRGGVEVTVAGVAGSGPVQCSRSVSLNPDTDLASVLNNKYDVIVCPGGGKGAQNLAESPVVGDLLKKQHASGGFVAAVCAGPLALLSNQIQTGSALTSHPSVKDKLSAAYKYSEERVVCDGKMVTSRGPGTTFEFALKLVELLRGKPTAESLVGPMLLKI